MWLTLMHKMPVLLLVYAPSFKWFALNLALAGARFFHFCVFVNLDCDFVNKSKKTK